MPETPPTPPPTPRPGERKAYERVRTLTQALKTSIFLGAVVFGVGLGIVTYGILRIIWHTPAHPKHGAHLLTAADKWTYTGLTFVILGTIVGVISIFIWMAKSDAEIDYTAITRPRW